MEGLVNDQRLPTADISEYILDYLALLEWMHKVSTARPEGTRTVTCGGTRCLGGGSELLRRLAEALTIGMFA